MGPDSTKASFRCCGSGTPRESSFSPKWLLDRGAAPNCVDAVHGVSRTGLDYVIATYSRSLRLASCIDILRAAGGVTKYDIPVVLDVICGRYERPDEIVEAPGTRRAVLECPTQRESRPRSRQRDFSDRLENGL